MHFKSLFVSAACVLALISCSSEPDPDPSPDSNIEVSSTLNNPVYIDDGGVTLILLSNVSQDSTIDHEYNWSFGDGESQTTDLAYSTHSFSENGTYEVVLVISDKNGTADPVRLTMTVEVTNIASDPIASDKPYLSLIEQAMDAFITSEEAFLLPCANCHYVDHAGNHGELVFSVTGQDSVSIESIDSGLTTWLENGGILNRENPISAAIHPAKFSMNEQTQADNETLWGALIDSMATYLGANSDGTVNPAPKASFTYSNEGNTFTFNASGTTDNTPDQLTYDWTFGDNAMGSGVEVSHEFADASDFTVTLLVSDGERSDEYQVNITTKTDLVGNVDNGESLYNEKCFSCHQTEGVGVIDVYLSIPVNTYLDKVNDAFEVIETTMPKGDVGDCTAQCAADIEAFMLTWQRVAVNIACDLTEEELKYGPRQMRLLTVSEYTNTISDLFGYDVDSRALPADSKVNFFSNQVRTSLDSARLDAFVGVADSVIEYSTTQDFNNVLGYSEGWSGLLRNAFRRPATAEEISAYQLLEADGIEYAMRALLTSPYFLFRSELGMTPAEFVEFNENADPIYKPVGEPTIITPQSLGLVGGALEIYTDKQFSHVFKGGEQVQLRATGVASAGYNDESASDAWPLISIGIQNGDLLYQGRIPPKLTSILVPITLTGEQTLYVKNDQQNHPQSGSRALIIDSINISEFEQVQFEIPAIDSDAFALTPYEMATFLAYTYTGTMPDAELLSAADAGLSSDAEIDAQIERLLSMDKAKVHFGKFVDQWLLTDNVLTVPKDNLDFTDDVREAMAQEAREIFVDVIFNEKGFTNLFNSNYTFVNAVLADFYGIGGVSTNEFVEVQSPDRGGLITTGAFLSSWSRSDETHLIKRAVKLRERALCQHMPPFPTDASLDDARAKQAQIVVDKKAENNGIIRQSHLDYINTSVDVCLTCHKHMINPLGVGMEDYDEVGLPRSVYANGLDVDFTGHDATIDWHQSALFGINDIYATDERREFQGVKELGAILATEDASRTCLNEMAFRFVMATGPDEYDHAKKSSIVLTDQERVEYSCVMKEMTDAMNQTDAPRAAFKQIGLSDIVRFRKQRNR